MSRIVNYQDVLSRVIKIWVVCYGAITLQVVAGLFMSHILLPYVGFLLMLMVIAMGNRNLQKHLINCSLLTHYTVYTLAVSGVLMLVANLMTTNFITNRYSDFANQNYPFHAAFIVYPVATFLYGIAMLRRGNPQYCSRCRNDSQFSIEESLRRNVLHHEAKVQIRMAFFVSLALSVIVYGYYFLLYRTGSSYRRFSPDVFFMYILPAVAYVLTVGYVVSRYFTVELQVSIRTNAIDGQRRSHIRYMVMWKDCMLLKDVVGDGHTSMWDTPVDVAVAPTTQISLWEAEKKFEKVYGSSDFTIKKLFHTSHDADTCLHCAAFLDDEQEDVNSMDGQWFNLRDLDMMLSMGVIARPFAVELHRVFTITMAWKTYNRDGKRIYPIKNYRPTFRLRDFKDWDVDYGDKHWLYIAENNEDKPFYKLRRFWRRFVTGDDRAWQKKNS